MWDTSEDINFIDKGFNSFVCAVEKSFWKGFDCESFPRLNIFNLKNSGKLSLSQSSNGFELFMEAQLVKDFTEFSNPLTN